MISPPPNIVFSLVLVPIFDWECDPADDAPVAPAPADGEAGDQTSQPDDASQPSTAQRLVFKGFQWRPTAEYVLFPMAPWADCFDGGSNEANAESSKEDDERRARASESARRQRAQFHIEHPNVTAEPTSAPQVDTDDGSQ